MRRLDRTSLAAGIVTIALGVILLLDAEGELVLSASVIGALVSAAIGLVLIASGLTDGDSDG